MIMPQNYKHSYDEEISSDEYNVINKFLELYRNQSIIIADYCRENIDVIPFDDSKIFYRMNKDNDINYDFIREINYNNKTFIVKLSLWRVFHLKDNPKCLTIRDFIIIEDRTMHHINFNVYNEIQNKWLFNIISIFDEKKIISPEQAHINKMYTNKALQKFIADHAWGKIIDGINQKPELANSLFIIEEKRHDSDLFSADFGTILYQLISYRQNNMNNLSKSELLELDKLIVKLKKADLLKVLLLEGPSIGGSSPTDSVLLESNLFNSKLRISLQYTVDNTELDEEKNVLNSCVRSLNKLL